MDNFQYKRAELDSPATRHALIEPSDSADLPWIPRSIYCQEAGTIVIRDRLGVELAYTLEAGDALPFRGVRVMASGTTGTWYSWE
ncbi:hypothetical protein KZZ08_00480 [Roseovarius mucosus]|uniref:spike base protein, RCAP_Rcc01079 family n=1 Tax=Roseovarius mucosus TaxID=215743 RepID=UPI001C5D72BB|nr:hypothetical protein [Roseovarius mucosus]MBW4972071.1 hypothetical protein [Roseovarius mucosus]